MDVIHGPHGAGVAPAEPLGRAPVGGPELLAVGRLQILQLAARQVGELAANGGKSQMGTFPLQQRQNRPTVGVRRFFARPASWDRATRLPLLMTPAGDGSASEAQSPGHPATAPAMFGQSIADGRNMVAQCGLSRAVRCLPREGIRAP
jgi:hypothetical protein